MKKYNMIDRNDVTRRGGEGLYEEKRAQKSTVCWRVNSSQMYLGISTVSFSE